MGESPDRVPVPGSEKLLPAGAVRLGVPDPDAELSVTLRLRSRTDLQGGVAPLAARTPTEPLSRADFARTYGAGPQDLALVDSFAHEHGLTVSHSSAARRTVMLSGLLSEMEAAFGVELHLYGLNGVTFRGRQGALSLPAGLAGVVEGVFGLDDRPQARTHFRLASEPEGEGLQPRRAPSVSYTPPQLADAYRFPAGLDGGGQTIAIIELGGGYRRADLQAYFRALDLPLPRVTAVGVDGGRNRPTGDAGGPDGEVMLDIEVAGALAPGAHIAVYFAPNTDAGFLNAVTQAAHDPVRRPSVISISWGAPESAWTAQAMTALSGAFQEAALLGVTVLAASGDDGSSDRVSDGRPHTDFPSSSPFATGCGGTRLTLGGTGTPAETVWNNGPGRGASGGGVSGVFGLPDYQQGAGVPANPAGQPGRGVPDVAAVADPQTGYRIRVDGQDIVLGGTSAVAPLWAGLVARLNQGRAGQGRPPLGFLNPRLYPLPTPSGLRDVTVGDNGAYQAGPGWDPCTGLGTPDGEGLRAALGGKP